MKMKFNIGEQIAKPKFVDGIQVCKTCSLYIPIVRVDSVCSFGTTYAFIAFLLLLYPMLYKFIHIHKFIDIFSTIEFYTHLATQ